MREYKQFSLEELRNLVRTYDRIPVEVAHELHYRLWDWLHENAEDMPAKFDWPGWDACVDDDADDGYFGGHYIYASCFLCAVHRCCDCPMYAAARYFYGEYNRNSCALYNTWADTMEVTTYKAFARMIRDSIRHIK